MSKAGDYEIGFGKTPKHTRFQPGSSGNPNGRPKGSKNLKTDLAEELSEKIAIRESGTSKLVSKQRAVVKSLVARAAKGDVRATNTLVGLMLKVLDLDPVQDESNELNTEEQEIIDALLSRLNAENGTDSNVSNGDSHPSEISSVEGGDS